MNKTIRIITMMLTMIFLFSIINVSVVSALTGRSETETISINENNISEKTQNIPIKPNKNGEFIDYKFAEIKLDNLPPLHDERIILTKSGSIFPLQEAKVDGYVSVTKNGVYIKLMGYGSPKVTVPISIQMEIRDENNKLLKTETWSESVPGSSYKKLNYPYKMSKNSVYQSVKIKGSYQTLEYIFPSKLAIATKTFNQLFWRDRFDGGKFGRLKTYKFAERHHIPSRDSIEKTTKKTNQITKNRKSITVYSGPAVIMLKKDHKKTASYGNSFSSISYREKEVTLIKHGEFLKAQKEGIDDVEKQFMFKYSYALRKMLHYTKNDLGIKKQKYNVK